MKSFEIIVEDEDAGTSRWTVFHEDGSVSIHENNLTGTDLFDLLVLIEDKLGLDPRG